MPEKVRLVLHRQRRPVMVELPPDDVGYGFDNIGEVLSLRENLPVLLAGGGTIDGGRHVKYNGEPLADLYLSLLDRLGVSRERVADSTGRLSGLTV